MSSIAVIGADGFVGRELRAAFSAAGHAVTPVARAGYEAARAGAYDVVVNAAMPSARFRAKTDPAWDFTETVAKTESLVSGWTYKRFIQISTVSARCQLDTVYGRHKLAAESLCPPGSLIARLGPMYGPALSKGVLLDMLEGRKVFIDGESRYSFAPVEFCARWIAANLARSGVVEVGSKNTLRLKDVAKHLGAASVFEGPLDHQDIVSPGADFPDSSLVLAHLDAARKKAGA